MKKKVHNIPETHMKGIMTVDQHDMESKVCNLGIRINEDGQIWICVDGISFIRFRPLSDRLLKLQTTQGEE